VVLDNHVLVAHRGRVVKRRQVESRAAEAHTASDDVLAVTTVAWPDGVAVNVDHKLRAARQRQVAGVEDTTSGRLARCQLRTGQGLAGTGDSPVTLESLASGQVEAARTSATAQAGDVQSRPSLDIDCR